MVDWSNELSLKLINEYQLRPCLWDVDHHNYKNVTKKSEAWEEIAQNFGADVIAIKRKMNSLLASFRRERQKEGMQKINKCGNDEVYRSKWFAFDSLLFLFEKFKAKQSTVRTAEDVDGAYINEFAFYDMANCDENSEGSNAVKCEMSTENESFSDLLINPIEEAFNIPNSTSMNDTLPLKRKRNYEDANYRSQQNVVRRQETNDPCSVFCEYVSCKLRGYNKRTKAIVEHLINNVLFDADMGKYDDPNALP